MDPTPRDSYFQVTVDTAASPALVTASGELDAATSEEFGQAIDAALEPGNGVALDLDQLTFIDSSGVRVITVALHRARDEKQAFGLAATSAAVDRIFDLTGVGELFEL